MDVPGRLERVERLTDVSEGRIDRLERFGARLAIADAREIETRTRISEHRERPRELHAHPIRAHPMHDPGVEEDDHRAVLFSSGGRRLRDHSDQRLARTEEDGLFAP